MPTNEFSPLPAERLEALSDPARNGPLVVSLALEVIALRADKARLDWFDALPCAVTIIRDQPKADSKPTLRQWIDVQMEATR